MKISKLIVSIFMTGFALNISGYSVPNKFPEEPRPKPAPKPGKLVENAQIYQVADEGGPLPLPPTPYVESRDNDQTRATPNGPYGDNRVRSNEPATLPEDNQQFKPGNSGRQPQARPGELPPRPFQ